MKRLVQCSGIVLLVGLGFFFLTREVDAGSQKIVLKLGGQYCNFYLDDVKSALMKVQGVKEVSFNSTQDRVFVSGDPSKLKTRNLVTAVNAVKGETWYCKAEAGK